jgi:hypothetical protein
MRLWVAAVVAAALVVAAAWLGVRHLNASQGAIVVPPSAALTAAPSTPSPTPSATPGPPLRAAQIDDATVEACIVAPRTGETWTTPTPAPDMASVLAQGHDTWKPYLVGHRGSAKIYVVANDMPGYYSGLVVAMIAEVDASGARQISCPSARSTDACVPSAGAPGVPLDTSTFYDSLTLPDSIDIGSGWRLDTSVARTEPHYGDALAMAIQVDESLSWRNSATYTPVTNVGSLRVVEKVVPASPAVPDLDVRSYALIAPTGLTFELVPQEVPGGDYESIRWDDGVTRTEDREFGQYSYAGAGVTCSLGQYSVQSNLDPSQWSRAGQTREGAAVYVPTSANPLVHAVRAMQLDARQWRVDNWPGYPNAGEQRAYPFASDAAFRNAHALYAMAGPNGVWQIRLRGDAVVQPWECE